MQHDLTGNPSGSNAKYITNAQYRDYSRGFCDQRGSAVTPCGYREQTSVCGANYSYESNISCNQSGCGSQSVEMAGCFAGTCSAPWIYGGAETVFWQLKDVGGTIILRDGVGPVFSGDDIDIPFNGSPRITLGAFIGGRTGVEFQYLGFNDWRDRQELSGGGLSLLEPLGIVSRDFSNADRMQVFTDVDLLSTEISLARKSGYFPQITWLAGFRYVNFKEKFEIHSIPFDLMPLNASDYKIRTKNDLYGFQLGMKFEQPLSERFGFKLHGKAGIYGNSAENKTFFGDRNNTVILRDTRTKKSGVAFLGELSLSGYYKINESLSFVAGYNVMWIDQIARAVDHLDFSMNRNSSKFVNLNEDALLHGVNVGFEFAF